MLPESAYTSVIYRHHFPLEKLAFDTQQFRASDGARILGVEAVGRVEKFSRFKRDSLLRWALPTLVRSGTVYLSLSQAPVDLLQTNTGLHLVSAFDSHSVMQRCWQL